MVKENQPSAVKNLEDRKCLWKINKQMLPYKIQFFLYCGGAAALNPFQSAFGITVLGLTASNIAVCYTAVQVMTFLLQPVIGYIADYFNRLKAVIMVLAVFQVMFCLFIIIIPNTGMPGIHTMELADKPIDTYCQLCFNSHKFHLFTPQKYLDEENFAKVFSCFSNNLVENIFVNCSSYIEPTNSNNDSFEIQQTNCNSFYLDALLPDLHTTPEIIPTKKDYFKVHYIKTSQFSSICLLPSEILFCHKNFSFDDLNEYCYTFSNESILMFQNVLKKSDSMPINCTDMYNNNVLQNIDEHSISIANFKTYQFWAFGICLVFSYTFCTSQSTMLNTACYESIQGVDYGQQRTWGAFGWGLAAPFAGFLNDYTESYMASWCLCVGFTALQIWNLSRMNLTKPDFSKNILKDMKIIFSSIEFLCFEASVFLNGIFTGIIWYYLVWFIVSIGGNTFLIGLVHTIQKFFGLVPALYFSGWLIKKLGHFNLVSLALISHGLRFFLYSYLHNAWWILPIESLHGFTLGSFYAAMTSYGKLNSKPGTEATMQAILSTTFEAVGSGVGCIVTGVCLEYFGSHTTFFYASFLCVAATIINICSTFLNRHRKGSHDVTES